MRAARRKAVARLTKSPWESMMARTGVLIALVLVSFAPAVAGQEKSVKPGINDGYKDKDVKTFIKVFELESREIYAQRAEIVKACKLEEGMAVADIGAGTGLFTRLFAREVGTKGKVYAVDIMPRFLEHIEQTCKDAKLGNVETVKCSDRSSELKAASVDVAFICDTYHHFEFPLRTMASIHQALKPGGRLLVIDFHRYPDKSPKWVLNHVRAGQEIVEKEIHSAGFKKVGEEKGLGLKENYFLRFEKQQQK